MFELSLSIIHSNSALVLSLSLEFENDFFKSGNFTDDFYLIMFGFFNLFKP